MVSGGNDSDTAWSNSRQPFRTRRNGWRRGRGAHMDYWALSHVYDEWIDCPGYPLEHDFGPECALRVKGAAEEMPVIEA